MFISFCLASSDELRPCFVFWAYSNSFSWDLTSAQFPGVTGVSRLICPGLVMIVRNLHSSNQSSALTNERPAWVNVNQSESWRAQLSWIAHQDTQPATSNYITVHIFGICKICRACMQLANVSLVLLSSLIPIMMPFSSLNIRYQFIL